jgi:copper chaperone CopZ
MRIEVLYFDGCPHHEPAVERVQEVLREEGIPAEISVVNVQDAPTAERVGFLGSPSIRMNGLDVEREARSAREYGMMCRTYVVNGRREGLPSRETIRQAIREAQSGIPSGEVCCQPAARVAGAGKESRSSSLFAAGSVFAAVVASLCCILPIVFAVAGVSIVGAFALFAAWRPYLLVLTFGLLGLGFYFAYRPSKEQCAPGSVCAIPTAKRRGRMMLWVASGGVVLFAAFPYYSGPVAEFLLSNDSVGAASRPAKPAVAHATFGIDGMDCAACARAVESKLKAVPGVRKAMVSYERKRADVEYDPGSAKQPQLEKAIEDAGYRVRKG